MRRRAIRDRRSMHPLGNPGIFVPAQDFGTFPGDADEIALALGIVDRGDLVVLEERVERRIVVEAQVIHGDGILRDVPQSAEGIVAQYSFHEAFLRCISRRFAMCRSVWTVGKSSRTCLRCGMAALL